MNVLKPFCAAVPWITLGVLVLQMHLVSGVFTLSGGVLFDLPEGGMAEDAATGLVALAMPSKSETLVFFDDARYMLGDDSSAEAFCEQLAERSGRTNEKTLLVLADRRVAGGDLMRLARLARKSGVGKILFAEKRDSAGAID